MNPFETQVGGAHYKDMKIQPTDFIYENQLNFLEGSAIKYICRHRKKGGPQDLDKAIHYLQILRHKEYPTNETTTPSIVPVPVGTSLADFMRRSPTV